MARRIGGQSSVNVAALFAEMSLGAPRRRGRSDLFGPLE